ncbi:MAG: phage shock protein A [Spirochaetia bacterium]|nr:phage shock protein A [Spirochaetia bacterium]
MQMFKRIADIFNSHVNSALDKMEDPAKMINLMIAELEDTQTKARSSMAAKKAEQATLQREKSEYVKSAQRWEDRARLAIEKGREDLAREALLAKKQANDQISRVEQQLDNLTSIIASQSTQLAQITDKLKEVKEKQQILIQRACSAKEKKKVAQTLKNSESADLARKFSELESKIERMEADAEMTAYNGTVSTADEFAKMENDSAIESELESLKAAMSKKKEQK